MLAMLLLLAGFSGCEKKADPKEAAQRFFEMVASGRTAEAYASSAFAFQAQQSQKLFEQNVKELGLSDLTSWTFDEPASADDAVKIRVECVGKEGAKFSLNATLIHESGEWRIYALKPPRSIETGLVENRFSIVGRGVDFVDPVNRQPVPDEATVKKMALDTLLMFNVAVKERSFETFHAKISEAWRKQVTEAQLERAFGIFLEKQVDLAGIKDVEVVLEPPPQITTDGLLMITGEYPTRPLKVAFALKYMYEVPRWRLFGIDVSLRK
jgi:hypothetical protein